MAIFSDIVVADSGRAINNGKAVLYVPQCKPSGNYIGYFNGINDVVKPSGFDGNVAVSVYASRFDDVGYYEAAHSGNVYGNVVRDIRQTWS